MRLVARDARQADRRAPVELGLELLGADVELVGVGVVEARRDVLPVVGQRRRELLLGGDRDERVLGDERQHLAEAVERQQLRDVGPVLLGLGRRHLRQLAVLGPELGRRRDLDALGLLERALREGREVGEPLDLDVEQLAADRALLGGRVDVEDVAAQRELAAVLDLVHALVAARDEPLGDLVEVEQLALRDLEAVRAQLRGRAPSR